MIDDQECTCTGGLTIMIESIRSHIHITEHRMDGLRVPANVRLRPKVLFQGQRSLKRC